MEESLTLTGRVAEVIYWNKENGYSIFDLMTEDNELVTCTGTLPFVNPGETVTVMGGWYEHPSYGKQLRMTGFSRPTPSDETEILNFLASGIIPGVRHATAEKIVSHFGAHSLRVIADNPERLAEIKGITGKRAFEIHQAYLETKDLERLIIFMQKHGIATAHAMRLYELFGNRAVDKIEANPYILCEFIKGISFRTADMVARSLGVDADDENRICAGISYALLYSAFSGGHTYLPRNILVGTAARLLEVDSLLIENGVVTLLAREELLSERIEEEEAIFLPAMYQAEKRLGRRLSLLAKQNREADIKSIQQAEEVISVLEQEENISLAPMQREAVLTGLTAGFSIITGGPGTGKTTAIRFLIAAFGRQKKKVALCAPTGRAAKRMSQLAGAEAKTIHRLLEVGFGTEDELVREYSKNADDPLQEDVIIVDEASMADVMLLSALSEAIRPGAQLILVGDSDQLPPVGAGNALKDSIASGKAAVVRLDTVFRQAEESMIVQNAHRINHGEQPIYNQKDADFFFVNARGAEDIASVLTELVSRRLPGTYDLDPFRDIQVLSPMKKTGVGVQNLNKLLQEQLNPPRKGRRERVSPLRTLREGDKVMQIKNNYDLAWTSVDAKQEGVGVYNGDIGVIESIDSDTVTVLFDGERYVDYKPAMLEELEHAYAVTVHKSQGSEFPAVVMPVFHGVPRLMTRNLIYTAVTRATRLVVLVGQKSAVETMVQNNFEEKRYSALKTFLTEKQRGFYG
ncbi:MAG: ATP-dependent RecD-like DNA helicase [Ruminococcaceae bacterium]|nr:ATP-dependent RecD-like DNA helicase [Oscillospiraceae bacterium]